MSSNPARETAPDVAGISLCRSRRGGPTSARRCAMSSSSEMYSSSTACAFERLPEEIAIAEQSAPAITETTSMTNSRTPSTMRIRKKSIEETSRLAKCGDARPHDSIGAHGLRRIGCDRSASERTIAYHHDSLCDGPHLATSHGEALRGRL